MVKKLSKKIVDVETGEVDASIEELLDAKYITEKKLNKAHDKKEVLEADIASMELVIDLITQKLDEVGYVEGQEE